DLQLTRREFELLHLLLRHPGEILDRRRLHAEVWGYTFDPRTNVADVFVGYVRRKLEAGGEPRVAHNAPAGDCLRALEAVAGGRARHRRAAAGAPGATHEREHVHGRWHPLPRLRHDAEGPRAGRARAPGGRLEPGAARVARARAAPAPRAARPDGARGRVDPRL